MWVVTKVDFITRAMLYISIHTTRVSGDGDLDDLVVGGNAISIRTTRVGGDLYIFDMIQG